MLNQHVQDVKLLYWIELDDDEQSNLDDGKSMRSMKSFKSFKSHRSVRSEMQVRGQKDDSDPELNP